MLLDKQWERGFLMLTDLSYIQLLCTSKWLRKIMENPSKFSMPFRTARIGTMKAYTTCSSMPIKFNKNRLKFSIKLVPENSGEVIEIFIPTKDIAGFKSFLGRGCPVIWFQTLEDCTKNIQKLLGMKKGNIPSPYYDPDSKLMEETHIGIVIDLDPIPYTESYHFKQIVKEIYEERRLREQDFHLYISHSLCNAMLVGISNISDKLTSFQKKVKASPDRNVNIYEGLKTSASILTESDRPRMIEGRIADNHAEKFSSAQSVEGASSGRVAPTILGSPPLSRNVNRARKSVPKSSVSVSLKSQMKGIEEKAGLDDKIINDNDMKNDSSICSPTSNTGRQDTGRTSCDEAESSGAKGKIPKDPRMQIWKGKTKKRVKRPSAEWQIPSRPIGTSSPRVGQTLKTPFSTVSASATPGSSMSASTPEEPEANINTMTLVQMAGQSITIAKCKCVEKNPHMVIAGIEPLKCMALDCVDGRLSKCIGVVDVPMMMTPSEQSPLLALCEEHREKMLRHECCPGCGMFCAGGTYFICVETPECPHRFHKDCMLVYRQTKNCLHCCGPMSKIREVVVEPRQDYRLRWTVAGLDPNKMEKKRVGNGRKKSARMGHRSAESDVQYSHQGIVKTLRPGLVVVTSGLPGGKNRDLLEEALCSFFEASYQKLKIHPKNIAQVIQQGDLMKLIQVLHDAEDQDVRNLLKNPSTLTKAVINGNIAMIYLLKLVGTKLDGKDSKGKTPLFYAEEQENVEIINFLIKYGADFTKKDGEGMTCMHHAAKNGRIVSCAALLAHDPDIVNMPDEGGWTPIVWSTEHKHTTTARYLEHFNADIMKADKEGNTCLHWAALSGSLDLLITCLQKHADVNLKNTLGDTALHIAARQDNSECVLCLTNQGADFAITNNAGKTPLECASLNANSQALLKFKQKVSEAMSKPSQSPTLRERTLSADLSKGFEKLPVSCVNSVDDAPRPTGSPEGFHYVTANVHTSSETIVKNPTKKMQSCYCYTECSDGHCLCSVLSSRCWYDKNGQLIPEFDFVDAPYIVECSETCWCPASCHNRVVQKGLRYNLQVHRTRSMGWSIRTLDIIPKGAFVCEYVGELISDAEADVREDDSYLFDLENSDGEIFCIDARYYGNVSRFINHLCDPNLMPLRVFIDHHDKRFPRLAYFSTKEIKAGEELGFDYGDRFWDVKCRSFTCGCGSPQCKYSEEAYRLKREQQETGTGNGSTT